MTKLMSPVEDRFHKYPVLRIPTEKRHDQLIIGLEKARAILRWLDDIKSFVERHDPAFSPEPHKILSNQPSIARNGFMGPSGNPEFVRVEKPRCSRPGE